MTLEPTWADSEAGTDSDAVGAPTADPSDLEDGELVALARRGDGPAREELARRMRRPAYALALQLLRNPDDAMDCTQDGLLRFFGSLDRIQPGKPVKPWLRAIVRNRARDLMRRKKVRRHEPLEYDDPDSRPRPILDPRPGPGATTERRALQRRVWNALGKLPEAQREILVLRDYQDLSYNEIAGVLAIPLGTVMSRLHRARKALGEWLREEAPK